MANTKRFCVSDFLSKTEDYFLEIDVPPRSQMNRNVFKFPSESEFSAVKVQFDTGMLANIKNEGSVTFCPGNIEFSWEFAQQPKMAFYVKDCKIELCSKKSQNLSHHFNTKVVTNQKTTIFYDSFDEQCLKHVWVSTGRVADNLMNNWDDNVDRIRFCFKIQLEEPGKTIPKN